MTALPRSPRRRSAGVRKELFAIHRWLGLLLGVPLFIVCSSGTLAVLGHELDWLSDPARRADPAPVDWAGIDETLQSSLAHLEPVSFDAPVEPGHAAVVTVDTPRKQKQFVLFDPATGEVTGRRSILSIQVFLRQFHKRFLVPYGLYAVTLLGFVLLASAVTGLVSYRRFWQHLGRLRFSKGLRVLLADAHRTLGLWSLLLSLIIAVTGIWYFVERLGHDAADATFAPEAPTLSEERVTELGPSPKPLPLSAVVERARAAMPDLTIARIIPPSAVGDTLRVDGQTGALLVRDRASRVYLDPYSGEVLATQRAEGLTALNRWADTADPLHFGTFGGLPTKLIWFVLGGLLSIAVLAGPALAEARRSRRAGKAASGRATRWPAIVGGSVAVGAIVAATVATYVGYDGTLVQGYGPARRVAGPVQLGPWEVLITEHGKPGRNRRVYLVHALQAGDPSWKRITLGPPSDPVDVDPATGKAFATAAQARSLRISGGGDRELRAALTFEPAARGAETLRALGLAEAPLEVPRYVLVFVVALLALELAGVVAWMALVLRPPGGGQRLARRGSARRAVANPGAGRTTTARR
jgi:uncharacterized iron-regulated membrane protein